MRKVIERCGGVGDVREKEEGRGRRKTGGRRGKNGEGIGKD